MNRDWTIKERRIWYLIRKNIFLTEQLKENRSKNGLILTNIHITFVASEKERKRSIAREGIR